MPAHLAAKVYRVPQAHLDKADPLEKLELATIVQPQEHRQDIRLFRKNGTHSKTLILGAILLQETVLPFDNAQFLCFIFFIIFFK